MKNWVVVYVGGYVPVKATEVRAKSILETISVCDVAPGLIVSVHCVNTAAEV